MPILLYIWKGDYTLEIDFGNFDYSNEVSGVFAGKEVKKGSIVYVAKSKLTEVTSINYNVYGALDLNYKILSEDIQTEITLK